jgi:uncharacterized ion transporter superfamily protein YfcC|tara:strand:+ start:12566 stop:12796 length:231 start_codon:yes stop_codon:yes gene_type:complete
MEYEDITPVIVETEPVIVDTAISMFAILSIAAVIVGGLIVFLALYLNKSKKNKNDSLVYEDEMGEQELKDLDDEIN